MALKPCAAMMTLSGNAVLTQEKCTAALAAANHIFAEKYAYTLLASVADNVVD